MAKKKALVLPLAVRRNLIEYKDSEISIQSQCKLLSMSRSSLYYRPRDESKGIKAVRNELDAVYTAWPFYGSRRIAVIVSERLHRPVNRKQVQRLMRQMGIQAIGPMPSLSRPATGHEVYPYLLRGRTAMKPNEIWSTDITYIRLTRGFAFLTAVIDWYSRYVLSWRLSNTLDSQAPIDALHEALTMALPEIFNTDQGSQFTSKAFTGILKDAGVKISMDGRGRALDNVFVERLWRTVKYEDVYPKGYETMSDATKGLSAYFRFYNADRPHQALGYRRPAQVYYDLGI